MKNIKVEIVGTVMTVTVDLAKTFGPSGSGKSIIIASSEGNEEVAPGIKMGLNVYKRNH